jgi:4-cresol dehydrogenase (hydroxylating)
MSLTTFEANLDKHGLALVPLTDKRALRGAASLRLPTHVVRPLTVEDVQHVQRAAQAEGVALWVTPNERGNGLLAPADTSPVLVDLSGMRQVLEVDQASAFVLVEPGVSYRDLANVLRTQNAPFWLDSGRCDLDSIVGSVWERAFGYTAYGDHLMMQCGLEVVTPDGTQVRTGMGAFPNGDCWQLFKYGFGPYVDGSFTQSGLGIPTKIGLWISPEPPAYLPFALRIDDDPSLVAAVEVVRDLRINMVVPNTVVVIDRDSERQLTGEEAAAWNIYGALYGLPNNVELLWGMLNEIAARLGKVRLEKLNADGPRAVLMRGQGLAKWADESTSLGTRYLRLVFALPIEGGQALHFATRTRALAEAAGCGVAIEQGTSWRALLGEVLLTFADGEIERAIACGKRLIHEWATEGIGVVRADPVFRAAAASTYSDSGFNRLQDMLHQALGARAAV